MSWSNSVHFWNPYVYSHELKYISNKMHCISVQTVFSDVVHLVGYCSLSMQGFE